MIASLRAAAALATATMLPGLLPAQQRAPSPAAPPRSVPVSNLRYQVTFDSSTAQRNTIDVSVSFDVGAKGAVLLSFPAWTPGSYEIANFARFVSDFAATAAGKPLDWDKLDYDTWRIDPAGARSVTVRFDYRAVSLDNAMAWSRPDFAFVNRINLGLYAILGDLEATANFHRIHREYLLDDPPSTPLGELDLPHRERRLRQGQGGRASGSTEPSSSSQLANASKM